MKLPRLLAVWFLTFGTSFFFLPSPAYATCVNTAQAATIAAAAEATPQGETPTVTTLETCGGDDVSYQVPITTSVSFDGVQFQSVYATTNSVITFGRPDGTYWDYPQTPSISIASMDWVVYPNQRNDEHLIISASDGGFQVDISARPIFLQSAPETTNIVITAAINTDGTVAISYAMTGADYSAYPWARTGARLNDGTVVPLEQANIQQVEEAPVLAPEPVVPTPSASPTPTDSPSPSAEPTIEPSPSPSQESTPEPSPTSSPIETSPTPSPVPTPSPTVEPQPTPAPVPQPEPQPEPQPQPEPAPQPAPEPPVVRPDPVPLPEPTPIPEPAPEPQPEPPAPAEEPAPQPEPPAPAEPAPEVAPVPAPEPPPLPEPVPTPVEPPPVQPEPLPQPVPPPAPEPVIDTAPEPPVVVPAHEVVQVNEVNLESLPPETPVQLDNGVVVTAEVAIAVELLGNPTELLNAVFTDPGAALAALGSVGADLPPEVREEAEKIVISAIIAGNIATSAAATAAAGATYRRKP